MKVDHAVSAYVAYKQSLGMRFATEARTLKSFSKYVGDVDFDRVGPKLVRRFLDGNGPLTLFWHRKFGVLTGFYRFCLARGYVRTVPLPPRAPQVSTGLYRLHLLGRRDQTASSGRGRTGALQH